MKRSTARPIALGIFIFALVLLCAGLLSVLVAGDDAPDSPGVQLGEAAGVAAQAVPSPSPTPVLGLTAKTIKLTVKTTEKACFGSAGCNVRYEIRAAITNGTTPGNCDVTYEVRGLDDPQIGTLHVTPNGRYTQDSYQSGQTPRSSSKLTAVVTDIECE